MKVLKSIDVKTIDEKCLTSYNIPTLLLMEHAGIGVAEEIFNESNFAASKVLIVAGKGNNGGDGLVVARILHNKGYAVKILLTSQEYSGDPKTNLGIVEKLEISTYEDISYIDDLLSWSDIVVDAIFGTGFKGEAQEPYKTIINKINKSGKYILSIDIPSGLTGDGKIESNNIVKADKTVTFVLPKENLLSSVGRLYTGELVVKDIGVPQGLMENYPVNTNCLTDGMVKLLLPKRHPNTHKGTYGTALIVGGSYGMSGAVVLACQSALRSGVGLLYTIVDKELVDTMEATCHESITLQFPQKLEELDNHLGKASSLLIGPGFSTYNREELFLYLLRNYKGKLVLDGDGLNLLASTNSHNLLNENHCVTPHPKEMSRLTGLTLEEVLSDPIGITREFSKKYQCTTVLKGSTTCIANKYGDVFLNTTGNNGLATGGSGDVLAGIIVSLIAQGLSVEDAAKSGVYLHGKTADIIAREKGFFSLLPSDIPTNLHLGFNSLLL